MRRIPHGAVGFALGAEYPGAAGLLTNVITKSGSNMFSGSANYFFQNDGLQAETCQVPKAGVPCGDVIASVPSDFQV